MSNTAFVSIGDLRRGRSGVQLQVPLLQSQVRLQAEAPDIKLTIHMIDPGVGAKIHPWTFWDHRRVTGQEMLAARGVKPLRNQTWYAVMGWCRRRWH